MLRTSAVIALTLCLCAGAQAASPISTTMTVTASTGPISFTATTVSITGSAKFNPGIPDTTGTFAASPTLTSILQATGTNVAIPFTITMSGGTVNGTINVPLTLLLGAATSGTGSATITGGIGSYLGSTGTFASVSGTSSGSLTTGFNFSFSGAGTITVGGGGTTGPVPTVTAVLDAGGYTPNIAEGSIFVVKGSNLSGSGYSASGFPLLTTYNSVAINFTPTGGGNTINAYMVYTYNQSGVNQLAAILPSTAAAGSYNMTVNNGGTPSAPFAVQVVKAKPGIISQDSSGTGLAVAQNFISQTQLDINRFTTGSVAGISISPAKPGQTLIAWATGLGPVTGGDNIASPGFNFVGTSTNVQVIVGGVPITPFYAGRAPGLAGADQIDFTLPSNIPTGCTVSFQISVNGVTSNGTFISIAPDATSNACVASGFTTAQLQSFDQGGTYTVGGFSLLNIGETLTGQNFTYGAASGAFTRYTGFQLSGAVSASITSITQGSCTVSTVVSSGTTTVTTSGGTTLDAGAITITGPAGSNLTNQALTELNNTYSVIIGTSIPIPGAVGGTIVGGTYTLNGAGGKDVGKFSASVSVGAPLVVAGGLPSSVSRSSPLTINWTGGNATDLLEIIGGTSTISGTTATSTTFVCTTTAGQKTFTVPVAILSQLQTATTGSLEIASGALANFSAPLTAGGNIDTGIFFGFSGVASTPSYQ